jgi:hypothetical protein
MPDLTSNAELDKHSSALEQGFYKGDAETHREHLRLRAEEEAARIDIAAATGISDHQVLAELTGLGIRVETLTALTLIPLIQVAWADRVMDEREREAVLQGALSVGIESGSASHRLLEIWTLEEPPPDLINAWRGYIGALRAELTDHEAERLEANILERTRSVAQAAGDALDGRPHISEVESQCIETLRSAFEA